MYSKCAGWSGGMRRSISLIVALDLNRKSFNYILFRPRVMVDVDVVDTSTEMMGYKTSLPVRAFPSNPSRRYAAPLERYILLFGPVAPLLPQLTTLHGHLADGRSSYVRLEWQGWRIRRAKDCCRPAQETPTRYTW